ncbi:MAG TPA: hypothetical protein PK683_23010, partial [Leptospiraceae bacterium]|nr:hypothetical protein [Leptospiraceae bacterium]
QLKEMTFINNLDSVLAYNAFNAPILFIFPLLECIQLQRICIWSGVPLKDQCTFRRTDRKQITAFEWRVCRFFVRSDRKNLLGIRILLSKKLFRHSPARF